MHTLEDLQRTEGSGDVMSHDVTAALRALQALGAAAGLPTSFSALTPNAA